jgi:hypothetical protein
MKINEIDQHEYEFDGFSWRPNKKKKKTDPSKEAKQVKNGYKKDK